MSVEKVKMEGLIDYLSLLLANRFANEVSQIFFGDIVTYLPSTFQGPNRDQRGVIAIAPAFDRSVEGERVVAHESRLLGVDIIVLMNMTPEIVPRPEEAFGERRLVRLVNQIVDFLAQQDNITLGGRVQIARVGNIDWSWLVRNDQAIRAAAIAYEAKIRIHRIE